MQVAVPSPPDEEELPWIVEVTSLRVTSPNWDRTDKYRQWKGRDTNGRDRYFRIEDEEFWALVRAQGLNPHIIDVITVQWAFHGVGGRTRDGRVLRVLEFNGEHLAEPLNERELGIVLGRHRLIAAQDLGQGDLFKL